MGYLRRVTLCAIYIWAVENVDSFDDVLQWKLCAAAISIQAAARYLHSDSARGDFCNLRDAIVPSQSATRRRFARAKWIRSATQRRSERIRLLYEKKEVMGFEVTTIPQSVAEEALLASPTRQNTGRCISPVSQGHFRDDVTSSSQTETSSPCRSPLPNDPSRARDAHDVATDVVVGSEEVPIPQVVAEEALGSRETPSRQDPKVTFKDTQDLHLVKPSPKDVSLEPHRSDASQSPGTRLSVTATPSTPQRKIVHIKSWYITSSSDGTTYINGLLYGHTRHSDGFFKKFPFSGSVDTLYFRSGRHEYLLDKSQAEENRERAKYEAK